MKKIIIVLVAIAFLIGGCSLLDMSSDERKEFAKDCLDKGLLVQITIDPVNDEQVTVECVPRVIFVPPSTSLDVPGPEKG